MGERDGELPEEERLEAYLAREADHGGWPEELAREHPDVFPVHPEREGRAPERRRGGRPAAVKTLVAVTAGLMTILVVAEATNSVIGGAGVLALLVGLLGVSVYVGFLAPPWSVPVVGDYYRAWGQAGVLVTVGLIALTGYFGWREARTVDELARLLTPVPEIVDATYMPTAGEMEAVGALVTALDGLSYDGPIGGGPDWEPGSAFRTAEGRRFWSVETRLDPEDVVAFYRDPAHRPGWELTAERQGLMVFLRGAERMLVFPRDDWPRPRTLVGYIHWIEGS